MNYESDELKPTFMETDLNKRKKEIAYAKSTQKRTPINIKKQEKKRHSKKQLIAAIAVAVVLSSVSSFATTKVSNFVEQMEIDDTVDKACSNYRALIKDAVNTSSIKEKIQVGWDQHTADGKIVDYDRGEIASKIKDFIKTKEERDIAIYTLYDTYGKVTVEPALNNITNDTITYFSKDDNTNYEGLNDYINDLGYKTLEEYEEKMREKIVAKYNYEKLNETNTIGGK